MTPEEIKGLIQEGLPGSIVEVTGDGHHFEATVIFSGFKDKNKLEQHRMVYNTLGDKMVNAIHALSIKTQS